MRIDEFLFLSVNSLNLSKNDNLNGEALNEVKCTLAKSLCVLCVFLCALCVKKNLRCSAKICEFCGK